MEESVKLASECSRLCVECRCVRGEPVQLVEGVVTDKIHLSPAAVWDQ